MKHISWLSSPILFILIVMLSFSSCASPGSFWGYSLTDFYRLYLEDGEAFLSQLELSPEKLQSLLRYHPGGAWYLGQIFERHGYDDGALILYGAQMQLGGEDFYWENVRSMLALHLEKENYIKILSLTSEFIGKHHPDPLVYSWVYTYRYEALLRTNNGLKAREELDELYSQYQLSFSHRQLPHGLLYYQAMIYSENANGEDIGAALEPYIFISDARNGHKEIYDRLTNRFQELANDQEHTLATLLLLLEAKSEVSTGEYEKSFLNLMEYLPEVNGSFLQYSQYRPNEGLLKDFYISALQTEEFSQANMILEEIAAKVLDPSYESISIRSKILEYQGLLLDAAGNYPEAAQKFEQGFTLMDETYGQITLNDGKEIDLQSLKLFRERLLWRWMKILTEHPGSGDQQALFRAASYINENEYFIDILSEYVSRLVRNKNWGDLFLLLQSSGNKIPSVIRIPLAKLLKDLSGWGSLQVSDDGLDALLDPQTNRKLGPYNQVLMGTTNFSFSTEDLEELLPMLRYVPYDSWVVNIQPDPEEKQRTLAILAGYLDFYLFEKAGNWISTLPQGVFPDPDIIVSAVRTAYDIGDWHGGLAVLESALFRNRLYGRGLDEYIDATGGVKELLQLLYPQAYRDEIEAFSDEFSMDSELLTALIREESRFDPQAGSRAGAQGLGQIIPETGADIAARLRLDGYDLHDPEANVRMTAYYLSYLHGRFTTTGEALAAYNGGQGRVSRWSRDTVAIQSALPVYAFQLFIPIEETRFYVRKVLESWFIYGYLYDDRSLEEMESELRKEVIPLR